jgi:hypothetical protein
MSTRDTNDEEIILLSYDEAVAMLPDGEQVHTILDAGITTVGADWDRVRVLTLLRDSPVREVTGPAAQSMGHGLAAYLDGIPVFIETRKQES